MQNNAPTTPKLIQLLQALSDKEIELFYSYVSKNSTKTIKELVNKIRKYGLDNWIKYDNKVNFTRLMQGYLLPFICNELPNNQPEKILREQLEILKFYEDRGFQTLFENTCLQMFELLQNYKTDTEVYYNYFCELNFLKSVNKSKVNNNNVNSDLNFGEYSNSLDMYYLVHKIKIMCHVQNRYMFMPASQAPTIAFKEEVIGYLQSNPGLLHANSILNIWFQALIFLNISYEKLTLEMVNEFHKIVLKNKKDFSNGDLRTLFTYLENKINRSPIELIKKFELLFESYSFQIKELILEKGLIITTYINVLNAGYSLSILEKEKLDKKEKIVAILENFVKDYWYFILGINDSEKIFMHMSSMAFLNLLNGNLKAAQQTINFQWDKKKKIENRSISLFYRRLSIKISMELYLFDKKTPKYLLADEIESNLQSFKLFIQELPEPSNSSNKIFLDICSKIFKVLEKPESIKLKNDLFETIEQNKNKNISEKVWLLDRYASLKKQISMK